MNKKNIIIGLAVATTLIMILGNLILFSNNIIPVDQVVVKIESIQIENLEQEHIDGENTFGYSLSKQIIDQKDKYKVIEIYYTIENHSDSITMEDVRCHPFIQGEWKRETVEYNSGNGTYYIYILPEKKSAFTQYIFVKADDKNEKDLYNEIINEHFQLTFYINNNIANIFRYDTGNGFQGMGKQKYTFKINDTLTVSGD